MALFGGSASRSGRPGAASREWGKVRDRYLQTYHSVCGWHEKIGFDEMVAHRFLTDERLVQETRFSSDRGAIVNFGDSPWVDPRGFSVPADGYHIVIR